MRSTQYNPGDTVWKSGTKIRGMVGWTEGSVVYVCWEVGYSDYERMDVEDIELANILDLLIDERETEYQYCPRANRCKCGRKTHPTRYGPKCDACVAVL